MSLPKWGGGGCLKPTWPPGLVSPAAAWGGAADGLTLFPGALPGDRKVVPPPPWASFSLPRAGWGRQGLSTL